MEPTDFELLAAWREGDGAAGQRLFERHFESVYRFFFNKAAQATDDLVQQTFLACVESKDDFRQRSSFRTYLLGIARNKLYKFARGRSRDRVDGPPSTQAHRESLASKLAGQQEQRLLLRALRELPLELQLLLELSYWEGLTDRELAATVDIPVGTVKSRLRKGRQELDTAMAQLATSPEQLRSTVDNFEAWARSIRALAPDKPSS